MTLTWGNVSGISDDRQHVVIKPSGVPYDEMRPEHMVVVDLDGKVVEGELAAVERYADARVAVSAFPGIGGITHTHSRYATMFAQARVEIPCFGTTHADHFYGPVPVTRPLTKQEVDEAYEPNTGRVIVERFRETWTPAAMPAVLVAGHAPFAWGKDVAESVKNAVALEAVAEMALGRAADSRRCAAAGAVRARQALSRKHGPDAYYGQK